MAGALRRILALGGCALLLASCSDGGATPSRAGAASDAAQPTARVKDGAPARQGLPPDRIAIRLRRVATGLSSPLGVTGARDGRGWLYVVEQDGLVRLLRDGELEERPFLDVTDRTEGGGEQGLLGLAFHPRYETNRRLFVNYTDLNGDTVIAEYRRARRDPTLARPASERVLLRVDQPFDNHNGGALAFGPDGMLYIALGDGGSAGDPQNNGQRTDTLLGKILRIDVASRATPYEIPDDNPFAGDPRARPEIWDYGLRNPWRISFDRATGALWIADVGQGEWEEVNREPADSPGGLNYGWRVKEGRSCYPAGEECDVVGGALAEMTDPLAVYSHDHGCSVTGGHVYRGRAFAELTGNYFFGDYCSGIVWAVAAEGPDRQDPVRLLDTDLSISSFGEDDRGEVYVTDLAGGGLYRLRAAP
ncbi:MAG TPA: PQQ-dependent sugar dehydrogenase [Actinomycetota bacterium]|nr:PQQ-dependent sugar dehydrogenase [Actinomycetota bacterium]